MDYAAWVNVVLAAALVGVTAWYARDAGKMRKAAEAQADATRRTLDLLTKQSEEQAGVRKTIVKTAIETARVNLNYWKEQKIADLAALRILPQPVQLTPPESASAVRHARAISVDGSEQLSSAFDSFRLAEWEITMLALLKEDSVQIVERLRTGFHQYLDEAGTSLDRAQRCLYLHSSAPADGSPTDGLCGGDYPKVGADRRP
ncbi:MAG TPA: hypothetical protein VE996_04060 [Terriglobales bacterium]|nr:hypothetical protein [Terriglobales bacterium]